MLPSFIDKTLIPHKPGIYIFKSINGNILYVGKAIDLYHRVSSYFSLGHLKGVKLNSKTVALVERINKVETIIVESELEALILEANLIKKYLPPYNIRLTDDKDYLYVKVTREDFPKVVISRKNELKGARDFFGPFPSSNTLKETLKKLRRVFPWCTSPYPKNKRPCFYYHLGLCPGACCGKISKKDYNKIIARFIKFMQGKKNEITLDLIKEMRIYSEKLMFEKAREVKKIVDGISYLTQSNKAQIYLENPNFQEEQDLLSQEQIQKDLSLDKPVHRVECFDISNIQGKFAVGSLVVLTHGDIDKKWYRKFKIKLEGKPNDIAMMSEMVKRRMNHPEWPKPDLVLVDGGRGQVRAINKIIREGNWDIPVLGLAKKMEWLFSPGEEIIKLPKSSLSLRLLQKIRDEAHRVAISYHRRLQRSNNFPQVYNYTKTR